MGKNNNLINAMRDMAKRNEAKNVAKASDQIVPQVYAALAIALHQEFGWGYNRINRAFKASQEVWENFSGDGDAMLALCERETGITMTLAESCPE